MESQLFEYQYKKMIHLNYLYLKDFKRINFTETANNPKESDQISTN